MADIRRAVGLLGAKGELTPLPVAADIGALVDEFVGAGLDVDFSVEGDLNVLPSATGLALYRLRAGVDGQHRETLRRQGCDGPSPDRR